MRKKTQTVYYVLDDKEFRFLVIPYEDIDGSLTLRGADLEVSINCNLKQANQLLVDLQKAIIKLEVYKECQKKREE